MRIKAIIFNLDLTLIDTREQVYSCFCYAFKKLGVPVPLKESTSKQIGIPLPDTFRNLVPTLDIEITKKLIDYFIEKAKLDKADKITIYPDVIATLKSLQTNAIKFGLLTLKPRWLMSEIIKKFPLSEFFSESYIVTENEANNVCDGLIMLAKKLDCSTDEIIYVGDSATDAQAAQAANVAFVGVLSGVTNRETLEHYPNTAIINKLADLLPYFS